jgi:DNA polymerase-3 subunit alpha
MEAAEETWTASIHVKLDLNRTDVSQLSQIKEILARYPGGCPGYLHLCDAEKTETIIALPEEMKLKADSQLARAIDRLLGYRAVETRCQKAGANGNHKSGNNNSRLWRKS